MTEIEVQAALGPRSSHHRWTLRAMPKPTKAEIQTAIAELREKIEDSTVDPLEQRLAQVAEDALRWSIEDTDWLGPLEDVARMATIIRNDSEEVNRGEVPKKGGCDRGIPMDRKS